MTLTITCTVPDQVTNEELAEILYLGCEKRGIELKFVTINAVQPWWSWLFFWRR